MSIIHFNCVNWSTKPERFIHFKFYLIKYLFIGVTDLLLMLHLYCNCDMFVFFFKLLVVFSSEVTHHLFLP